MTREEIEAEFVSKALLYLDLEKADLKPEARLVEDLGLDSLGIVELLLLVEETFDLDIPDEETESIRTVKDCVDGIERKLAEKARSSAWVVPGPGQSVETGWVWAEWLGLKKNGRKAAPRSMVSCWPPCRVLSYVYARCGRDRIVFSLPSSSFETSTGPGAPASEPMTSRPRQKRSRSPAAGDLAVACDARDLEPPDLAPQRDRPVVVAVACHAPTAFASSTRPRGA